MNSIKNYTFFRRAVFCTSDTMLFALKHAFVYAKMYPTLQHPERTLRMLERKYFSGYLNDAN
jgi:hypothetical protein